MVYCKEVEIWKKNVKADGTKRAKKMNCFCLFIVSPVSTFSWFSVEIRYSLVNFSGFAFKVFSFILDPEFDVCYSSRAILSIRHFSVADSQSEFLSYIRLFLSNLRSKKGGSQLCFTVFVPIFHDLDRFTIFFLKITGPIL